MRMRARLTAASKLKKNVSQEKETRLFKSVASQRKDQMDVVKCSRI